MITNKVERTHKQIHGQFYTSNVDYILKDLVLPIQPEDHIIEPFVGKGDLIGWIRRTDFTNTIHSYDIDPKIDNAITRDTLRDPPNYNGKWIITNPPYLARNKATDKSLYDMYKTNDLYKCFIHNISGENHCNGGIIIIPAGFFFSTRPIDIDCRDKFMTKYHITKVRYFEENVFDDTSTTVVAVSFIQRSSVPPSYQRVIWEKLPSGDTQEFMVDRDHKWVIGGQIYGLITPTNIHIRRHVEGVPLGETEQQTHITLNALDSGKRDGRIKLEYRKDYVYPAKEHSRTYATIRVSGTILTEDQQKTVCDKFNEYIEKQREKYWSLFLPQFRESKEYARKRIPFKLAYNIIAHIIHNEFTNTSQ
jgi:hypothetical protein